MSCVVCESDGVQLRPAVGVLVVCRIAWDFSKEQSKLPEDDRMIETCRSVLSALM